VPSAAQSEQGRPAGAGLSTLPEVRILGVRLDNVTTREALTRLDELIADGGQHQVCIPNVDCIVQAQQDREFFDIINRSALVIPDGMGVIYASRVLGTPLKENVKGRILTVHLCRQASERGRSVFLMGGEPGVPEKAAEMLVRQFPGLKICGTLSPPFGFEHDENENRIIVDQLHKARPDILLVALGAPKQEKWIARYLPRTEIPVALGVGCTFDVISGRVKSPPGWMTDIGLEWLFRLTREPGRLWKRYLIRDPKFFWKVVEQKLGKDFSVPLQ